jgi:hypothetical protein
MATKRAIEALQYAEKYIKNMPLYRVQVELLDDVSQNLWYAAPWRWTLGTLPSATLINNTQNYAVTLPSDFEYGYEARLVLVDKPPRTLEIVGYLPNSNATTGMPSEIAITGSGVSGNYSFNPTPSGYATFPSVVGFYKKIAPTINETTIYTAGGLNIPDQWFNVYKTGVLAWAYRYADDARAGNVTFSSGQTQYSGVRAEYEAMVQEMREREKLPIQEVVAAPNPRNQKG